jgi:hypothetical protein
MCAPSYSWQTFGWLTARLTFETIREPVVQDFDGYPTSEARVASTVDGVVAQSAV